LRKDAVNSPPPSARNGPACADIYAKNPSLLEHAETLEPNDDLLPGCVIVFPYSREVKSVLTERPVPEVEP
jgi:hypothetical protein